jgi:hypothetical protein
MRIARNIGRTVAVDLVNAFLAARYSHERRRELRLGKDKEKS